jgi:hypothetical protein
MVGQALAEARTRGAARVTALHLVMYDDSPQALEDVRQALAEITFSLDHIEMAFD